MTDQPIHCPSCDTVQSQSMTDMFGRTTCLTCAAASVFDDEPYTAPFVAPWRRRQIAQAGGRFVAVTDTTDVPR